jgi:hypothetical protein
VALTKSDGWTTALEIVQQYSSAYSLPSLLLPVLIVVLLVLAPVLALPVLVVLDLVMNTENVLQSD